MPGDSTELTFVRCPSCRSLVPAISTKCRMCGAVFESEKSDAASSETDKRAKSSGRVRQKTSSAMEQPKMSDRAYDEVQDESYSSEEDPLADYMEEVAVEEPVPPVNGSERIAEGSEEPQVIVERGKPEEPKLSFGPKAYQDKGANARDIEEEPMDVTGAEEAEIAEISAKPDRIKSKRKKKAKEHNRKATEKPHREQKAVSSVPKIGSEGRLIGWLVDFTNPLGKATELREDKFFITRDRLKDNDMLIDDESISTPHALVRVSVEGGVEIQDLMSERGVFVRRENTDSYRREEDRIELDHGDWVRVGDIEFLVCLVPTSKRKTG
ncbi:MAG: FHA domain-containing protein [Candidatus Dadabacteria bacterium]|nr:MAG: FHA domain-containing protein [Candidatus Dadabacteria bacterium]